MRNTCKHPDGCSRVVKAFGWCRVHAERIARNGDPGPAIIRTPVPLGRPCVIDDCTKPVTNDSARNMCGMHYQRFRAHGDPHVVKVGGASMPMERNPNWSGGAASYNAVHLRLRHQRGNASAHPCEDCERSAAHWSYDLSDPNEKAAPEGPYSTDLSRYVPRCVSCHKIHDLNGAA